MGILRQNRNILLAQQQGRDDPTPSWVLPEGMVEDGELLIEALRREVRQETGLDVMQVGVLAYLTQMDNPLENTQSFTFVFEIAAWSGVLQINDPDSVILKVEFTPIHEAILRIQELPWQAMREPAAAYLSGEYSPGKLWIYRLEAEKTERRLEPL